jgi:Flp pilus assembly protein TadG
MLPEDCAGSYFRELIMFSRKARRGLQFGAGLRRFSQDAQGGVTIMFSLLIVVLCMFVGAAVDIGRWAHARYQTIQAMDAAVLAGGSVMQAADNPATALTLAQATAQRYYVENTQNRPPVTDDTVSFTAVNNNTQFVAVGNAYIETVFLNFARIPKLPLLDKSEATYSKAELTGGGGSTSNGNGKIEVEIAMMLDVTGSMAGSKIVDLKAAAKDLINIVITEGTYARKVRVALVPFSEGVRLPSSSNTKARGSPAATQSTTVRYGNYNYTTTYYRTDCVVERTGTNKYTDVAPGTGNYVMTLYDTSTSCALSTNEEVVPLSSDKEFLKGRIDKFSVSGGTAGQIGTAWAWYMLSPSWNTLWSTAGAANAYGDKTQKIAILMTDGEYNLQYDAKGIATGSLGSGAAANGTSPDQAKALCTAMKAKGITVYTVGFALGGNATAIATLSNCASSSSTTYTADNGTELKQAFRDIAKKITPIYLSH